MFATNSPSAGVYTAENDLSQRITANATSIGAIVAASHKGPIGVPTLVVDNEDFRRTFGIKNPSMGYGHYAAEAFLEEANRLHFVRVARNTKYGGVIVHWDNNFSTTRHLPDGFDEPTDVTFSPDDVMLVHGVDQGHWNNDVWIQFFPNTNDPDNESFILQVFQGTSTVAVEQYEVTCFRKMSDAGQQLFVEDVVNNRSRYIRVRFNQSHRELANTARPVLINAIGGGINDPVNNELNGQLTGGHNGDPITTGDIIQAWDLFADIELIDANILINAGYSDPAIQLKMNEICETRQDCIAILDAPSDLQDTQNLIDYRRNVLNLNSSLCAMYTPDLRIRDTDNGVDLYVPPSGYVAAIFSRTDEQAAPWFAPAGLERGQVFNVQDVKHRYKQGHRNALEENQINPIRSIAGQGIIVYGADTMYAVASALNDIGIRRMLAMLHSAVQLNNLFAVFQPNDAILRARQRQALVGLLEPIRRGRGLYWYDVVCDERNNPNDVVANGDLIVDVYLDPTRYTKRIHLNAVVPRTGGLNATVELLDRNS
jgi:hypothetical protein